MPEYRYEWELIVGGFGPNPAEAWERMEENLFQDNLEMPVPITREITDEDLYPDDPPDTSLIAERPMDKPWLIWSVEHNAWWRPARQGYTLKYDEAGRYEFAEAIEICKDAGFIRSKFTPLGIKVPAETMILAE